MIQLSSTLFQEQSGQLFERITFTNGITDYFYSDYMHHINSICFAYGLNISSYIDFVKATNILKTN